MNLEAESAGAIAGIAALFLGGVRWFISLLVKPIIKRIDALEDLSSEREREVDNVITKVAILTAREEKNSKAICELGVRIGRINDRVEIARDKSHDNDVKIKEVFISIDQLQREKSKLFEKSDRLEIEVSETKVLIAGIK